MPDGRDDFPNAPDAKKAYDQARAEKAPDRAPEQAPEVHSRHTNYTPEMTLKPVGSWKGMANEVDKNVLAEQAKEKLERKEAFNKQYGLEPDKTNDKDKGLDKDKSRDR